MSTPTEVRVRMYNVGFGDCFLLSVFYPDAPANPFDPQDARTERHVLIDFGTSSGPRNRQTSRTVAKQLALDCGGHLDAVVITHRHRDHLSAFGSKSVAKILATLNPTLIVRSWTENPKAPRNSGKPLGAGLAGAAVTGGEPGSTDDDPDAVYLGMLDEGQRIATRIFERSLATGLGRRTDVVQAAEDETANKDAVDELDRLAKAAKAEYLSVRGKPGGTAANATTKLSELLPGVGIRLLGPPRPRDWPAVSKQAEDSDEYWLGADRMVRRLFAPPTAITGRETPVGTQRWIVEQLQSDERRQLSSLVRWLDEILNNTSLILLFEVGNHRMLFGGDAQIENWSWALERSRSAGHTDVRDALIGVDFYKVGHHGSRNATPKSLQAMWKDRPAGTRFISMLSTKDGVHGKGDGAVPRGPLVDALKELGQVLSTDEGDVAWIEVRAAVPDGDWQVTSAAPAP